MSFEMGRNFEGYCGTFDLFEGLYTKEKFLLWGLIYSIPNWLNISCSVGALISCQYPSLGAISSRGSAGSLGRSLGFHFQRPNSFRRSPILAARKRRSLFNCISPVKAISPAPLDFRGTRLE